MPRPPDAPKFPGFVLPRYTPIPDALFDELLPDVSGAELKVLLYILRRTLGFKKDADRISLSQICSGIVTREGQRLDRGTGLSRSTAVTAIRALEDWGVLLGSRRRDRLGSAEATIYQPCFVREGSPKIEPGWSENRTPPSWPTQLPLVRKANRQETVEQEPDQQETDSFESRLVVPRAAEPDEERAVSILRQVVIDFGREFEDLLHERSNVTRAINLWRRSGLAVEGFVQYAYEARRLTRLYQGKQPPGTRIEAKGAYFFAVLEQMLSHFADQHQGRADRAPPTAGTTAVDDHHTLHEEESHDQPVHDPAGTGTRGRRDSLPAAL
jgi:hypothetical protein